LTLTNAKTQGNKKRREYERIDFLLFRSSGLQSSSATANGERREREGIGVERAGAKRQAREESGEWVVMEFVARLIDISRRIPLNACSSVPSALAGACPVTSGQHFASFENRTCMLNQIFSWASKRTKVGPLDARNDFAGNQTDPNTPL
jgi:hypothetical protein